MTQEYNTYIDQMVNNYDSMNVEFDEQGLNKHRMKSMPLMSISQNYIMDTELYYQNLNPPIVFI